MKVPAGYLYVIVLSLWVGGMSLFTFIVTPVIFRSYARDAAGEIVGKLFPSYFLFTLAVSAAALILFLLSFPKTAHPGYRISLGLVCLAVGLSLYVKFGLHPAARKVKEQVHSFETPAPDDPARIRFRRLHALSAVINIFMIVDGLVLLVLALKSFSSVARGGV
jgi:hypothetical protein